MILILASAKDVHARRVSDLLNHHGHQVTIFDAGTLGNGATITYPLDEAPIVVLPSGQTVSFNRATCVWYRRPRLGHVAEHIRNPAVRNFCRQEWANLLEGLFLNSNAWFVNPVLAEYAAVKPRQLHVAREVGWTIPDTLITSDQDHASAFIQKHHGRVIHKAMTAPRDRLIDTRVWDEGDRSALKALTFAPTIFQEMICGPVDLRITVVGQRIFTAKISTELSRAGIDSRMDMDAPYEPYELPDQIHERVLAFMAAMGLVYGTIDLKVTPKGEYVFLEVNPQGQFLYVEILTKMPIASAMADLLAHGTGQLPPRSSVNGGLSNLIHQNRSPYDPHKD